MEAHRVTKIEILGFFALATAILLWGNHTTVLWNQDEAAYAGFGLQMIESGNWLVPVFEWSDVHRKTPLHFWFIASTYLLMGVHEFSVRFSSVLSIFGTLLLMWFVGRRIWSERIALTSCFVLLSSLLVPALGKIAVTDATLLFFQTLSAFSLLLLMQSGKTKWVVVFWIALAFGMLVKGPSILVFAGLLGLIILILHPRRKRVWKLKPWIFFPVSVLPLFIWGYLAWQTDGGNFIRWLIDWYGLRRISGNVFGQTGPPGYYLAVFCISFLPWLPFVLVAVWSSLRSILKREFVGWSAWFVAGWLLFEFLSSKLPAYTIAAHPALAIGIASAWLGTHKRSVTWIRYSYLILGILGAVAIIFAAVVRREVFPVQVRSEAILFVTCVAAVILVFAVLMLWRGVPGFRRAALYVALLPNIVIWLLIMPAFQEYLDGHLEIADYLESEFGGEPFQAYIGHDTAKPPSLPFYIIQAGGGVKMEKDAGKLLDHYNRQPRSAFILSQPQLNVFRQSSPGLEVKEFTCFIIDRQKMASYFVVLKE